MATESSQTAPPGTEARELRFALSCPSCGGPLTYETGVKRGVDGICLETLTIVRCRAHGWFEIEVRLVKSQVTREKRPSGAEQRKYARQKEERRARAAVH